MNNDGDGVLGIRIARKNYSVGLFDLSGTCIHQKRVNIKMSQSPETTMKLVLHDSKALLADSGDRIILAAGVAIPGPYSIKKGRIELMTGVQGWNNISIKNDLEEALNIPVFVEQNANAGALAQYWHNDEQYRNEMLVYIAIGQGVGAGIINNGDLIRGAAGMAGEIGTLPSISPVRNAYAETTDVSKTTVLPLPLQTKLIVKKVRAAIFLSKRPRIWSEKKTPLRQRSFWNPAIIYRWGSSISLTASTRHM